MRYVFVSDIHGCYDKLIAALDKVHFNKDADTIVSLGDAFDRGTQSWEVLEFLMSCPNRILVWGNHDHRLYELFLGKLSNHYDLSNGVLETMQSFCGNISLRSIGIAIQIFKTDDDKRDRCKLLFQYFNECNYAVEWSDLVGIHGWIPYDEDYTATTYDKLGRPLTDIEYKYNSSWREASLHDWYSALWCHTEKCFKQGIFEPTKTMIVGHWHAWRLRSFAKHGQVVYDSVNNIDCGTFFYKDRLIAIDGCSNFSSGVVNTYVYETDEVPCLINPIK